jgi:type IV pilus assembly protein PilW
MKSKAGFTLIEVLVAMAVSLIILGSAYSVFLSQQKNTVVQTNISDIQQNLRAAMDFLARDIRMAGYAGTDIGGVANFGFTDVGFKNYDTTSNGNGSGFVQFSWDMNDNGLLAADERVSYSLANDSPAAPGSIALMRELGSGGREPMAGYVINLGLAFAYDADQDGEFDRDAAGNVIWAVDTNNDGTWDNLDTNGDGQITEADLGGGATGIIAGASTGTPLRYGDIRAVRIWLLGRSQYPDNSFVDNRIYVVGRDVIQPSNNFRHRLLERTVLCRNMGLKK